MDYRLTTKEQSQLEQLSKSGKDEWARRARIILLKARDLSTAEISREAGLSPSRVRYWVREFKVQRLGIFPEEAIESITQPDLKDDVVAHTTKSESAKEEAGSAVHVELKSTTHELTPTTIEDLCHKFAIDMNHARHVAEAALYLFDHTSMIHVLPEDKRPLCRTASILHNIGLVAHPQKHHTFGRDILLEHRLIGFDDNAKKILAFTTALHRKKYRNKRALKEARICGLPEDQIKVALGLAALVRIADGLDYSQSQTTRVSPIKTKPNEILFSLSGPFAYEDGLRAQVKADLWESLYAIPIRFAVEGEREIGVDRPAERMIPAPTAERLKSPGVLRDDWMSEAGRKVLRLHYYRMLDHEEGTRRGEDIEELHDMRVAIRRMRAAIRIFRPYFKRNTLKPFLNGLQRTGRALGNVRDLDVFMQKAQEFIDTTPLSPDLAPLLKDWDEQLVEAREKMIAYLDHKRYGNFVSAFGEFLNTEGAGGKRPTSGEPTPLRVFQCVPAMIYERDQRVRAYDGVIQEPALDMLHSLRIDIKRLRYTLEYFKEVLGEEAKSVIRSAVQLQDHLGDLHDADVACQILIGFLDRWRVESQREQIDIRGITDYLVTKQLELRELVNTFPEQWEMFNTQMIRRDLALAVAHL